MIVHYFSPIPGITGRVWGILTVGSQYVLILHVLILLLKVISIFGIYLQLFK